MIILYLSVTYPLLRSHHPLSYIHPRVSAQVILHFGSYANDINKVNAAVCNGSKQVGSTNGRTKYIVSLGRTK